VPGAPAEQLDVASDVLGGEGDPVGHGIKFKIFNFIPNGPRFPYVAPQHRHSGRERTVGALSPVSTNSSMPLSTATREQAELMTPLPPMNNTLSFAMLLR
jgi:hypothetical protein